MKGPSWIKQWIADLAVLNEQFRNEDGTVDFEALGREEYAFRTALVTGNFKKSSRALDSFSIAKRAYDASSENGAKGGRPRKNGDAPDNPPGNNAPARIPYPRSFQEVADFAGSNNLDYDDARLWWQRNFVERKGRDKDGRPIANWKGALVNACLAEALKRKTA